MASMRRQVGTIFGNVASTSFDIAVGDPDLKRLDYVAVETEGHRVLGQVDAVVRRSSLSYEQALDGVGAETEDQLTAAVRVIGYRDPQGRIQTPRSPFRAGTSVYLADDVLVTTILGLEQRADEGAYLGFVKGSRIPVTLSMDTLAQKHLSVLAKTGAGKSYTVGVILEEFLKANVPLVILDPHGEYGSLRHANLDEAEMEAMRRHGFRPKGFSKQVKEYAIDVQLNPEAERLVLEGMNLEGRDIVDMLGNRLSGGQVGVLYQAIKEVKEYLPAYTLRDIMDGVARNKSNGKWNVLNALEVLEATKVFDIRGTPVKQLVAPGQCTIVNLKGVNPDVQEIVVTRITNMLWEARKRNEVPAHILVVEEAHNFCPERNVGNAVSGAVIRTVASEGRKFGLGLVIVSQRPAKIDKNVLSQCNTQVVLKVTNPNDLKAIVQSVEGISGEVADEIQRLAVGEALVAGGGLTQPVFVAVRPRMTRHGGRSVSVVHQEFDEDDEAPAPPPFVPAAPRQPGPLPPPGPTPFPPRPAPPPPPEPEDDEEEVAVAAEAFAAPPRAQGAPVRALPGLARDAPLAVPPAAPAPPAPRRLAGRDAIPLKPRLAWSIGEAREIHRVASRIGLVGATQDPERTVQIVGDLESSLGRDPDARLRLLREIAGNACHEADPACVRCPLAEACQHQDALAQERRKTRSPLRRLWR